jgi:hypothetical protein
MTEKESDLVKLTQSAYDKGVADERKRCFDIATDRVETCYRAGKIFPNTDYEKECAQAAVEALLISQRIDEEAWKERWKSDENYFL